MATNLAIEGGLIEEARRIGGHSTTKQAVALALEEYVARATVGRRAGSGRDGATVCGPLR